MPWKAIFLYPRNDVRGWYTGITLSVSQSIDARFGEMVKSYNCLHLRLIIMKLHTQTPHESRMCANDIWVKRSKIKVTMH